MVDEGWTDTEVLVASLGEYGVTIVGPTAEGSGWQARAGEGFDKESFAAAWDRRVATCPAGEEKISWLPNTDSKNGMGFETRFTRKDCTPCPPGRQARGRSSSGGSSDGCLVSGARHCKRPGASGRPRGSASGARPGPGSSDRLNTQTTGTD